MAEQPFTPEHDDLPPEQGERSGLWRWVVLGVLGLAAVGWELWRRRPPVEPVPTPEPLRMPPPEIEEEIHHADGRIEHPKVRREHKDARFGLILGVLIGMCCVATIHYFAVWKFYWSQAAAQQSLKASPTPLISSPSRALPPEPILDELKQVARIESGNVYQRMAAKEKVLNQYGPDEEKGFVHIPIQEAMREAARQLPVRNQPDSASADDSGLVDSGESNSGRMLRRGQP